MEDIQKAGGYIRIENGADRQDGITAQKSAIESFAGSKGIKLLDFYIDQIEGGASLDKREGYARLNADIVAGKVNTVITSGLDRFTSDERERQGLMHNFAEKGVEMYFTANGEHVNPSDPITREQRLLGEMMRDMEDQQADRLKHKKGDEPARH